MNTDSYSSTSSYAYVEPLLTEKARELLVISPYIGTGYAKMLVDQGRRKKVRVVTSGSAGWLEGYAKKYSWSVLFKYLKIMAALFLVGAALIWLQIYNLALFAVLAFVVVCALAYMKFKSTRRSNIKVKVSRNTFIHEKVYVSDSRAVIGSANLTYPGMHKNLEHVQIITDHEKVEKLRRHFEEVWRSC